MGAFSGAAGGGEEIGRPIHGDGGAMKEEHAESRKLLRHFPVDRQFFQISVRPVQILVAAALKVNIGLGDGGVYVRLSLRGISGAEGVHLGKKRLDSDIHIRKTIQTRHS